MQATRPPRTAIVRRHLTILFLLTSTALTGQDFILPDLVLSRQARQDIPQPGVYSDISEKWIPELPRYRRQYPLAAGLSPATQNTLPGRIPAGLSMQSTAIPVNMRIQPELIHPQFNHWTVGAKVDIREGADALMKASIPGFGVLGGIFFVPFSDTGPRPWSGEINWGRIGALSADVRAGVKDDAGFTPYGSARLNWNGGIDRPDSYSFELLAYGLSDPGLSGFGGTDIEIPLGDSEWSIITEVEGGGWYSSAGKNGMIRSVLAAGLRLPGSRLTLSAGADAAYSGSRGIIGAPFLSIHWYPKPDYSFFADTKLNVGFPHYVDTAFRREKLSGFVPEIPINTRYRLGFIRSGSNRIDYHLEISYGYGLFTIGTDGVITTVEDKRLYGSTGLSYNIGSHRFEISGSWDVSIQGNPDIWESKLEYSGDSTVLYIKAGSEDAILAGYLPGIRGEQPIMGIGFDWIPSESWEMGTFAYTAIPWDMPSLKFSLGWRN